MQEILPKKCQKMPKKYLCGKCDFSSNNKYNYQKHLQTIKHNTAKSSLNPPKKMHFSNYVCECGNKYTHRQSLTHHKKTCTGMSKMNSVVLKNVQNENILDIVNQISDSKQNNINIVINNNYNSVENIQNKANTIQNNNTFSVKNYLNTECKDAFTVQHVLDNFCCDIMTLPSKPVPFYKDVIDNAFKNMPLEKLPIRCSDTKRKIFYGNAPHWNKDFDIVKEFLMRIVDTICDIRMQYSKKNPEWYDNNIISDVMNSIIINISKIYDEKTVKQIIQYIAEKTKIEK